MSVLLVDECCGSKSAEGDRLTVRLSHRQNPQLEVWLCVSLHAQHRQMKRNLATSAIIFGMRVMQMTQPCLKDISTYELI